jgi:uncharacterized protein (DUF885 family)
MTPDERSAGQPRERLSALAAEYWEGRMRADPVEATLLGDRRYDDRMPEVGRAANEAELRRLRGLLERVRALGRLVDGDAGRMEASDRITLGALAGELESEVAVRECRLFEWAVDPREGPQVLFLTLANLQTVTSPEQGRALVSRWQKMGGYVDGKIDGLRLAASEGRLATRESVVRVLRQLDELLAQPTGEWVLMAPAKAARPGWPAAEVAALQAGVKDAVERSIRPAFERYAGFLRAEILPRARGEAKVGVRNVPEGLACYDRLIGVYTSLSLAAAEIHRIGLEEIARIRGEMSSLGERLFGTRELAAIQARLRGDRGLYFGTRDEIEAKAREALRKAEASMPRWLGRFPRTPCVVKRVEPFEEKDMYIAYYRQPAADGSRPGAYYVNTYAPETRPRFEAEVLAFHESIPGHHVQIALAQEMQAIPEFRKHLGVTSFVEGWALYTERLADELGLYGGDLDRMGMLSFDAWRAARLVVDTGIHVEGWSRGRAIAYMTENTALAPNNIENEVDRYIGWPGQALAYKLGQREIFALRREAQARLGARFDLRSFHDVLLGHGAVSLAVLRREILRWIGGGGGPFVAPSARPGS